MSRRAWLLLPLLLFIGFVAAAAWRLSAPPETSIRSRLVGREVPAFTTAAMLPGRPGLAAADLGQGKPRLVNFFASWCVPCIAEAPVLVELQQKGVMIDAIALRDDPDDVANFLANYGDPLPRSAAIRSVKRRSPLAAPAFPKASSSMAKASSATSTSARSRLNRSRR
jgi:cytochrome c biogenesis protein CcmG/thiol:disulfide interchange protein DsbE